MLGGIKNFVKTACAVCFTASVFFGVYAVGVTKLPAGDDNVYYLHSVSSQARIVRTLSFADLFRLTGESALFYADESAGVETGETAGKSAEKLAEEILSFYDAAVCFTEDAGGTLSYYCCSPRFTAGVVLNGHSINLHVAVRADGVAVGCPIIFGGY